MELIVSQHIFSPKASLFLVDGAKVVEENHVSIADLTKAIFAYCSDKQVTKVTLCGNKNYLQKYAKDVTTKYTNVEVEIKE